MKFLHSLESIYNGGKATTFPSPKHTVKRRMARPLSGESYCGNRKKIVADSGT
jgi:hypothetical protein